MKIKKKLKVIIPSAVLVVGIVLAVIGLAMGAKGDYVKSLELTLSGVVPEVKLVCGSRTETPNRTALTRTVREDERYLSYLYVFGLDRAEVVLRAYIDPVSDGDSPVYIERDITDIVNKALDEAEQTGDPRIEFELELEPLELNMNGLQMGRMRVVGWDEVDGGDMGV